MLDSVPVPLLVLLWPLAGAALSLVAGRFLPGWLRRLIAVGATAACLAVLWPPSAPAGEHVAIDWEPLNLFRAGPVLALDSLARLMGILLAWVSAAILLGLRGSRPHRAAWYALFLLTFAGCLAMTMAANLLGLAMGSAWIDLGLLAMALFAEPGADRVTWRMAVPGLAATLLLFLAALVMGTQVGSTSLLAREVPAETLGLIALAGVLRLLAFPFHPRGLPALPGREGDTGGSAATLLLLVGGGSALLFRTGAIGPAGQALSLPGGIALPWLLVAGVSLLVGGFLCWTGGFWPALAIHQAGSILALALLLPQAAPWPLLGPALALALLLVWYGVRPRSAGAGGRALPPETGRRGQDKRSWAPQPVRRWVARLRSALAQHLSPLIRWQRSAPWRRVAVLLPALAWVSLLGLPLTVGAVTRWHLYAALLHRRMAPLLLAVVVGDALLAAGLWTALVKALRRTDEPPPTLASLLAMTALAVPLVALALVPRRLNLPPFDPLGVSVWGLGLVCGLPWLAGGWLAWTGARFAERLVPVRRLALLNWLFRALDWAGRQLLGAIHWLSRVGEGEGWWGWALVVLALAAIFLTVR